MKKSWILLVVIAAGGLIPLSAASEDLVQRSFNVGSGGLLTVKTDFGSIDVKSGTSGRIDVEILRKSRTRDEAAFQQMLQNLRIDFNPKGNDLEIIVKDEGRDRDGWRDRWGSDGLNLEFRIAVPYNYNVDLATSGGSIQVDDLQGEVEAKTSGGSLAFGRIAGPVHGRTSGGSISLDGCTGSADVTTSGGSIKIGQVEGDVKARTSGGSISVEEVYGTIDASTSGGSVTARISSQPRADCRLSTSGGSVTVDLASGIGLDLDAETSSGRVISDISVGAAQSDKRSLRGPVSGGGPSLVLRTSGGNIYLRQK